MSLAELTDFKGQATLIAQTGIQFIDLGATLDTRREAGQFVRALSNRSLVRLEERQVRAGRTGAPELEASVGDSIRILEGTWLPIPFFRRRQGIGGLLSPAECPFMHGPTTWARARIVTVSPTESAPETHRVVLAFDTTIGEQEISGDHDYLQPVRTDIEAGAEYSLATRSADIGWFLEHDWVESWLADVFREAAHDPNRKVGVDLEDPKALVDEVDRYHRHQAHYLNWLALIGQAFAVPRIVMDPYPSKPSDQFGPGGKITVEVDLVLDVGNSRTCGIMIERHRQTEQEDGLQTRYQLQIRDLSQPELIYDEAFESRLEFAQPFLGKTHFAVKSGRGDAFLWPTLARVGREAARLAASISGSSQNTGLSSPKRYLWDHEPYGPEWSFNIAYDRSQSDEKAIARPLVDFIDSCGEALHRKDPADRFPALTASYSRSALMTFFLMEVIAQALMQMNSPAQRERMPDSRLARRLTSITLTVPPSMPKEERLIFRSRLESAIELLWRALGWYAEQGDYGDDDPVAYWPPKPEVGSDRPKAPGTAATRDFPWDEATCGQLVFLYSEAMNRYRGRTDEFFDQMRKPQKAAAHAAPTLTVASIDIGGGTTDLVINDYRLASRGGANIEITPVQRFRDGFKTAGDDVLLAFVKNILLPQFEEQLRSRGAVSAEHLLSELFGSQPLDEPRARLRRRMATQVLHPLALHGLAEYEKFDPLDPSLPETKTICELIGHAVSSELRDYVAKATTIYGVRLDEPFDTWPITIDCAQIHAYFRDDKSDLHKVLSDLCEIIHIYDCDVLLLTGRPSRLPVVFDLVRMLLPIAPDRIVTMHGYRCGTWYPFHRQGRIEDPKTTAAVGAMLCVLARSRIRNFFFEANRLRPYSTMKVLGILDGAGKISRGDECYDSIDLDDEDYELPADRSVRFITRSTLGFRQFDSTRWPAAPLYTLDFANGAAAARFQQLREAHGPIALTVSLSFNRRRNMMEIANVETTGPSFNKSQLSLKLNTMRGGGLGTASHWLDSGNIIE